MGISYGTVNLDSLIVPGAYINIRPPSGAAIQAAQADKLAFVGIASWGPVNAPTAFGSPQQGAALFGQQSTRKFDFMTHVQTAAEQGANNFIGVRVTDGSDVAASIEIQTNCLAVTSKYTGTGGSSITVSLSAGSQKGSYRAVIAMPGVTPETFDNMATGLSGNAVWVAIAAAINAGTNVQRGPSQIGVASAGAGTATPVTATYTLSGGTDGVSGVTATTLIGNDAATPRTGMYALRGTKSMLALLADCDVGSTWPSQVAYGLSEGTFMVLTGPSGDSIANAVSAVQGLGLDSFAYKYLHGDWPSWLDPLVGIRTVSPQGFVAGLSAAQGPNQSTLNKEIVGIVGTQSTAANRPYSNTDLATLISAGIDVIINPSQGGDYFGCASGHNGSSNPLIFSDAYSRMTFWQAATLNGPKGLGQFIGDLNTPDEQSALIGALSALYQQQWDEGIIGNSAAPNDSPFSITLPAAVNTQQAIAVGEQFAQIDLVYLGVVEKLVASLNGGASVQITRSASAL